MPKPSLVVDFDGVLHSYKSGWKGIDKCPDPPVPGAIPFLMEAVGAFDVYIHSSRSHDPQGIHAMQAWLRRWTSEYLGEHNSYELCGKIRWPNYKPPAFITIDDRCVTFTGVFPSIKELFEFKPWYRK